MKNLIANVRVIIVDNDQSELDDLIRGMNKAHIPALPFLYSADEGVLNKPEVNDLSIRLLFIDMNLTDASAPSAKDIAPTIAEVIETVISKDNGPYALIFWSKHAHLVDEVVAFIVERHVNTPVPIAVGYLDKNDFRMVGETTAVMLDVDKLHTAIDDVVAKSPQLSALMLWEREISNAASNTLVSLSKFCKQDTGWNIPEYVKSLEIILSRVAEEATGRKNAQKNPAEAIHLGLQPLLIDNFERDFLIPERLRIWSDAMPSLSSKERVLLGDDTHRALNTFYCLSQNITHLQKTDRGVFVKIADEYINDKSFLDIFGKNVIDLSEEFISVYDLQKPDIAAARQSIIWGLIEISADCDHAQKKSRLYRYMLAAVIPNKNPERTKFRDSKGEIADRKHLAIYRMPEVILPGNEAAVIFANYRYLLGLPATSAILGDVVLKVRGPILGELLYNYSRYVARPGVISFG